MIKSIISYLPLAGVVGVVAGAAFLFLSEDPTSIKPTSTPTEPLIAAASPTATDTPTSIPTDTPTPIETPASSPTDTPEPTTTDTPTLEPSNTPTPTEPPRAPTDLPPTDTPEPTVTPTPSATSTPAPSPTPADTPTPTATLVTEAPTLLDPQPYAAQYKNRIELEWDWVGTLGPDDYFQVEIRNRSDAFGPVIDGTVLPIDVAWVKDKFYGHDYVDFSYDREYTWRIVVVRGIPPREKDWAADDLALRVWEPAPEGEVTVISDYSEMRTLFVEETEGPPPPDIGGDTGSRSGTGPK